MIYGHIDVPEARSGYPEPILKALDYCRAADLAHWEEGRYLLDGEKMIALVFSRETGPKEEKRLEVHRRYIELQFMADGEEYIGFYPDRGGHQIEEDCLEEKDTLYYRKKPEEEEIMLPMRAGCYAVFFPEDVHRPFCQMEKAQTVKRIVVKIDISTL